MDIAQLAVMLGQQNQKPIASNLAEAAELLARAAQLIPDVERRSQPGRDFKGQTVEEMCALLAIERRTLAKHCKENRIRLPGSDETFASGALSVLRESVRAAASRK
jgi:hypothetical protein